MEGVLNMSEQNLKQVLAKKQSILQGDAERIAKQRAAGKLTARERVAKLLDAGSFVETDALVSRNGDYAGVVTGSGTVQLQAGDGAVRTYEATREGTAWKLRESR